MSSYLLAFTLLTGQTAKILLMAIWMSLAMFATALQKQLVEARAQTDIKYERRGLCKRPSALRTCSGYCS